MSGVYIDFIGNACSTLHCPGRCEHSLRLNEFRKREILQHTDKQKKRSKSKHAWSDHKKCEGKTYSLDPNDGESHMINPNRRVNNNSMRLKQKLRQTNLALG